MRKTRIIFQGLICATSIFVAMEAASVENLWLLFSAAIIFCLVTPTIVIRRVAPILFISAFLALWRIFYVGISRGCGYISYGAIFGVAISTVALLLVYGKWKFRRLALWVVALMVIAECAIISRTLLLRRDGDVAYLERGRWGISHSEEKNLDIKSQYSYNIIKKCINAKNISSLDSLDSCSVLWTITPTQPFNVEEIKQIEDWVRGGGHLVVVSDHTDLFGHASVVNDLIKPFQIEVGKDCIISKFLGDSVYWFPAGWFHGLTGNTIRGMCNPILLQWGYRERADYAGRSFFSDNAITDEDRFGVYCVGAYRAYGRGRVTVFSDSTLFADFGMSTPAAQIVLRMLRDGIFIFNIPAFLLLLCLCYVSIDRENRWMRVCFSCCLLALLLWIVYTGARTITVAGRPLSFCEDLATVETTGNWDLVDADRGKYCALFAANYAADVAFPEWSLIPKHQGDVVYNGRALKKELVEGKIKKSDLTNALTNNISVSTVEFLRDLQESSSYDGIWFDAGAGIAKEVAYKNFWRTLSLVGEIPFEIEAPCCMRASYTVDGKSNSEVVMPCMAIKGRENWVVVGDWMIGKWVNNEILVRSHWQHVKRKYGDIVIIPKIEKGK